MRLDLNQAVTHVEGNLDLGSLELRFGTATSDVFLTLPDTLDLTNDPGGALGTAVEGQKAIELPDVMQTSLATRPLLTAVQPPPPNPVRLVLSDVATSLEMQGVTTERTGVYLDIGSMELTAAPQGLTFDKSIKTLDLPEPLSVDFRMGDGLTPVVQAAIPDAPRRVHPNYEEAKVGSSAYRYRPRLRGAGDEPVDLTQAEKAYIHVELPNGTTVVNRKEMTFWDRKSGILNYDFSPSQLSNTGIHLLQIEVEYPNNVTVWFPTSHRSILDVFQTAV